MAKKAYFLVPDDITIMRPDGKAPLGTSDTDSAPAVWSLETVVREGYTNDMEFSRTPTNTRRALDIMGELKGKGAGDLVELDNSDWELLKKVISAPTTPPYPTFVMKQILPFAEAILNATEAPPVRPEDT